MPYLSWPARLDDLKQLRNYASGALRQEIDGVIERLTGLPSNSQACGEVSFEPLVNNPTIAGWKMRRD